VKHTVRRDPAGGRNPYKVQSLMAMDKPPVVPSTQQLTKFKIQPDDIVQFRTWDLVHKEMFFLLYVVVFMGGHVLLILYEVIHLNTG
jgi:hypothetical protein